MLRLLAVLLAVAGLIRGDSSIVPGAFIIETSQSALMKGSGGTFVDTLLVVALGNIANSGVKYKVRQTFTDHPALFHGASINVDPATSAAQLLRVAGVTAVWPIRRIQRPNITVDAASAGAIPVNAADLIVGPQSLPRMTSNSPASLSTHDSAGGNYSTDNFAPHQMTGVDKTHIAAQLGAGVLICLLDAGVDYKNPILGGCFGPGCHISVGYDLVGDAYDGGSLPVPGADPYASCDPHGSHTSGIVGALANGLGFSGVAPEASLGMFRVLGCVGSTTDDIILQAYIMAMTDSCDVINMSLAGPTGFESTFPLERMVEKAAAMGIFTAISAGNSGAEGMFYASEPASNRGGVSVAAVNSIALPALSATVVGFSSIPYLGIHGFNVSGSTAFPVYFTSTNPTFATDACAPLPPSTPNLAGYVVVVQGGGCTLLVKSTNIANFGGQLFIVYGQYTTGIGVGAVSPGFTAAASMRLSDGLTLLKNNISSNGTLAMIFPSATLTSNAIDTAAGGLVAALSSFGTTFDLYGTNFGAPGANIVSTFPLSSGGVAVASGTSMAAPFIAGAAAVIMAARPGLSVAQIRSLLSTTAKPLPASKKSSTPYSTVALQGSGLIQVNLAVAAGTLLDPIQFSKNDTSHLAKVHVLSITNSNSFPMLYSLTSVAGQGRGLYDTSSKVLPSRSPPIITAARATVTFSRASRISVSPGATVTVTVNISPPNLSALDAALFPTYSGWVVLAGTQSGGTPHSETLRVPYFGISGSLFDAPILDTTNTVLGASFKFPFLRNSSSGVQTLSAQYTSPHGPSLYFRLAMGSALVTIDLVPASLPFTGTIASPSKRDSTRMRYADVPSAGQVYQTTNSPRNSRTGTTSYISYQFTGTSYTMGVVATKGVEYRLLLRALKITGDPVYEDQYESWLSPSFSFTPALPGSSPRPGN